MDSSKLNATVDSVGSILRAHLRVLKLTKKPSREEFLTIAKVAGLGILAIGMMGFLIYVAMVEIPKWV
ncbi:MAG: protein translocase SEC61 complex subunit gamma [Methanomethylovorans sp.]|uniref:protein translocase SEC61 complex subunit gamma n=1 Tax=Methanomethylovorans sp. TaxID=2758717 RepID=UPI0035307C41